MHGGAPGSGAPRGNKNAFKHGLFTRESIAERRQLSERRWTASEFFGLGSEIESTNVTAVGC
jgi:uncharacterized protein YjcR